jgi:hypothetical protein
MRSGEHRDRSSKNGNIRIDFFFTSAEMTNDSGFSAPYSEGRESEIFF